MTKENPQIPAMPIRKTSAWDSNEIETYLTNQKSPLRLAGIAATGVPTIASLWYLFSDGCFWCCSHRSSFITKSLLNNPVCGFEVSANEPPYKGVRGQGKAMLHQHGAEAMLTNLIENYLHTTESTLAQWLLGRSAEEYIIRIQPTWISAWDYSSRMDV